TGTPKSRSTRPAEGTAGVAVAQRVLSRPPPESRGRCSRLASAEPAGAGALRRTAGAPVGSARRLASRRAGPWAPLAGSLRARQATKDPRLVFGARVAD